MKLRNKKTGEVLDSACIGVFKHQSSGDCERVDTEARSLSKFLEQWEDYTPAEPLIKDEKVRNLVKNFALYTNATWIQYESTAVSGEFWTAGGFIGNNRWKELEGLVNHRCYTITELCGEEEE